MSPQERHNILERGDVNALRAGWAKWHPNLPQPKDKREAEIMLHIARTQDGILTFSKRAYSHRWLTERNLPSALPDALKPSAERMYPKVVTSVGIACRTTDSAMAPAGAMIRGAMEQVVLECYAEGRTNPDYLKKRMQRARTEETKRLFGAMVIPRG